MNDQLRCARFKGLNIPVGVSAGQGFEGIGVAQVDGKIALVLGNADSVFAITMNGDQMDQFAGLLADAIMEVSRIEHPSLAGVQ